MMPTGYWLAEESAEQTKHSNTNLDQQRQRAALHSLLLVFFVFERQRAQRACARALHLDVCRVQQRHQRRNTAVRPHPVLCVLQQRVLCQCV